MSRIIFFIFFSGKKMNFIFPLDDLSSDEYSWGLRMFCFFGGFFSQ